ncbi:hypothetical protein PC113_g24170 [Phytophthora cactorum]|uniref:Uncharacterized protein n=1 Tax=Phytophthora cactorum TaxID=29920 RepID=A0A8T0XZZ5_9STRA|nr:hypothetical protein PC113_g24170 [Phytophthora cactorum]
MDQNHLKRLRSHSARQAKPMKLRRSPNALAVGNKCSKCALHLFNRRDVIGVVTTKSQVVAIAWSLLSQRRTFSG